MPAVYDNWARLVAAALRREENRELALRTPSDLSSLSSSSSSPSFYLGSFNGRVSSFTSSSILVGESFPYHQILQATDGFSDSKLIKRGHSGVLYSGILQDGIQAVVKKVRVSSLEEQLGLMSEFKIYGMANHSRLVPLLGYCFDDPHDKFLVYKYMPNKDLFRFLSGEIDDDGQPPPFLKWIIRLKIAIQTAEGLCYLHHQCFPPLVHRDIQASSILLDDGFEVRLGSLSGVCIQETNNNPNRISRILGIEQRNSGTSNATSAYDVYSFGKVLLELVTGKRGVSAADGTTNKFWTWNILRYIVSDDKNLVAKVVDPHLVMGEHMLEGVWAVAFIAKACLTPKPSKRPKMIEILKALEGLLASSVLLQLYPNGKIHLYANSRIFSYVDLKNATRIFGWDSRLGQDEFGTLYRGLLQEKSKLQGGKESPIVVKEMHLRRVKGFQQWQAEAEMLGRLSHPNILELLGYCMEENRLLLVYKFMHKGSLKKYFSTESSDVQNLTWDVRLKILIGAARGLAFLHESARQGFFQQKKEGEGFYGYFSCSKILLDSDYNPKITGFGVAEVDPPDDRYDVHPYKFSSGKYEYGAPEYLSLGEGIRDGSHDEFVPVKAHFESDVYGFGVILVRMLTGVEDSHHTYKLKRVMPNIFVERYMDRLLRGKIPSEVAEKMVQLAQLCLRRDRKSRPSIELVLEILEGTEKIQRSKDDLDELESSSKRLHESNCIQDSPVHIRNEGQEISEVIQGGQKQNAQAENDILPRAYKTIYISASRLKHQKAGFGGIVLNEERSIINAWAICGDQNVSLAETGLQAIGYAQVIAEKKSWKKVQIRCDVQGIVNKINQKKRFGEGSSTIVEDINHLRDLFEECSFVYIPKEWNESCNRLADIAVESQTSQEWSTAFPSWLIESKEKGAI